MKVVCFFSFLLNTHTDTDDIAPCVIDGIESFSEQAGYVIDGDVDVGACLEKAHHIDEGAQDVAFRDDPHQPLFFTTGIPPILFL